MMGLGRDPFMGAMGIQGPNPPRDVRSSGIPPKFAPVPSPSQNNCVFMRDQRGLAND